MNKSLLLFTFFIIQNTFTYPIEEMLNIPNSCKILHKSREHVLKLSQYKDKSLTICLTATLGLLLLGMYQNFDTKMVCYSLVPTLIIIPTALVFELLQNQEISKASDLFIPLAALKNEVGHFIMSDEEFIFLGKKATHFSNETLRYIAHKLGRNVPNL